MVIDWVEDRIYYLKNFELWLQEQIDWIQESRSKEQKARYECFLNALENLDMHEMLSEFFMRKLAQPVKITSYGGKKYATHEIDGYIQFITESPFCDELKRILGWESVPDTQALKAKALEQS